MSSYRTPESLIRSIMAGQNLNEGHAPALKIPEPERVSDALKVLSDNGITASKKDDNTIAIGAADINKAVDILDHALANGVIQAKPITVSAEALPVPEVSVEPVQVKSEPHPPAGGNQIGEDKSLPQAEDETEQNVGDVTNGVKLNDKSLNLKMQIKSKIIDEEQIDEVSKDLVKRYVKSSQADLETSKKVLAKDPKGGDGDPKAAGLLHRQYKRYRGLDNADYKLHPRFPGKIPATEESAPALKKYVAEDRAPSAIDRASTRIKNKIDTAKAEKSAVVHKAAYGESANPVDVVLNVYESLLLEGKLRLIATHHSDCGKHTAKVYKDSEWGEHTVKYHINGKHHEPADSFHGDVEDAHGTARSELKRMTKLNGALKEAFEAGDDMSWIDEEVEQVDELSKQLLSRYASNAAHDKSVHASKENKFREKMYHAADAVEPELHNNFSKAAAKHGLKANNRDKGIRSAFKKLTSEESEQIDELSKALLKSYEKKSVAHQKEMIKSGPRLDYTKASDRETHKDFIRKKSNREDGEVLARMKRTGDKSYAKVVAKEELEPVEEVTKQFLKNYLAKNNDHQETIDREHSETGRLSRRTLRKGINREKGEKLAQAKIQRDGRARIVAREEVEKD